MPGGKILVGLILLLLTVWIIITDWLLPIQGLLDMHGHKLTGGLIFLRLMEG